MPQRFYQALTRSGRECARPEGSAQFVILGDPCLTPVS